MKIYTRTGDDGSTGLRGGRRAAKDSATVELLGGLDELNAALGLTASHAAADTGAAAQSKLLTRIQRSLFSLGAAIAAGPGGDAEATSDTRDLEEAIDRMEAELPPLANFILPGGTPAAASAHLARCVCRRAERVAVQAAREVTLPLGCGAYLNRLSDLLFVLARWLNHSSGTSDVPWSPEDHQSGSASR